MTQPPQAILDLVERFSSNVDLYRSPSYNETQARREFIDPFFAALGWDVDNKRGVSPRYREVIHEASLRVGGSVTAPDYCFRVGTERKFFVEAKKPAVSIQTDIQPAYQLRRYAWTAKLPLSILTDFEEFSVYDCRFRPKPNDKASQARVLSLTYDQYPDRWDEIAGIFSREAVWKGDYDRYTQTTRGKRGTQEVDREFLKEIEGWRVALARNIALRNPDLSVRELNYAVQKTIDRILFLRICEDRGIEPYEQLKDIANGAESYGRLLDLFRRADERFNSGIFHFREEKGRNERPDTLTPTLSVDDKVLRGIINKLYYPDSPYEFSVLSVEILGNVYEQFLGSVIRLTPKHRAVVEQKPEVRKAGGVYYTPKYIVEYIVQQTVGELCKGKTPGEVARLRILDPACGSGSFLLGAYEYLLNYHLDWYVEHQTKRGRKEIYQGHGGDWFLTTEEKKRILLNNIYGVDIDPQAVEVTKLSLLLKVLEAETRDSLGQQLELIRERALPDLASNIKCGNSLIGPDFYDGEQLSLLDTEEMYRINPFDWEAQFAEIMQAGGFDAVIGNPPYIRIQTMKTWAPTEVEFYKKRYTAASKGNYDIYVVFVERALQLLNESGWMGYILPHKFFQAKYGQPLRQLIATGRHLAEIVHFGDQQVFKGASTYTCLLFLNKKGASGFHYIKAHDLDAWCGTGEGLRGDVIADRVIGKAWNFVVGPGAPLFERLSQMPVKLGDVATKIFQGIVTSADPVYTLEIRGQTDEVYQVYSKFLDAQVELERRFLRPFLKKYTIEPYAEPPRAYGLLFPYTTDGLVEWNDIKEKTPHTARYLEQCKSFLSGREHGKMAHKHWFAYVYPKNLFLFRQRKLIVQVISKTPRYTLDETGLYFTGGGNGPYYGLLIKENHRLEYVLGLLNAGLLGFYLRQVSSPFRGGYWSYGKRFIEQLPIRTIDSTDPADVQRHDRMVALVERMLALHKQLADAKTPTARELLQRQIDATDGQIDRLVYELYGLTEDEIGVVEESA